jgi:CRISPR-associated exonuclease Cas4
MTVEPVIAISAIEHHAYCPRQCALIHVDGVWTDNRHTLRGQHGHRRVDSGAHRMERGRRMLRALPLWSESLGLVGRADAVEVTDDGRVAPVEYKIGTRHGRAADLQLCAQALCLEEMLGVDVPVGFLWFSAHRRRERVELNETLRLATLDVIEQIRLWFQVPTLPPAVDDERCAECQLVGHCLPAVAADPGRVVSYLRRELAGCAS